MRRRADGSMAEMFSDLYSDYVAVKTDALNRTRTGLAPMGASADWHIRFEWQYLHFMELARDVDRNDVIVGQGIDRVVDNVVQQGFPLSPQTGNREADSILSDRWTAWGEDKRVCHFGQTCDWLDIKRLTLRQTLVDGDMFNLLTNRGSIDTVEGHRCRRPRGTQRNVVFGILKNDDNQPEEVWLTKENIQPMQQLNLVSQINRYRIYDDEGYQQVLHGVLRSRTSMTRGISVLAPIFKACGLHDDIQFAELVKRQVQSCIAFMREISFDAQNQQTPGTAGEVELRPNEHAVRLLQQIYPGMEITGKPGEKLSAFSPNVAGSDFIGHSMLVLTFIAVNLGVPVQVLLLDPTKTNFSGWRGAIDQARIKWRRLQHWLIQNLDRPTYKWKVRSWIAEDSKDGERLRKAIASGAAIFKHLWHPPGWAYIEPLKDAQADTLRGVSLLSSPRRILGENQYDWNQIVDESVEDQDYKICTATEKWLEYLEKYSERAAKFGKVLNADWRDFTGQTLPQGMTMAIGTDAGGQNPEEPAEPAKPGKAA